MTKIQWDSGFIVQDSNLQNLLFFLALVKIRSESGECAAMTDHVQTICLPPPDLKLEGGTKCEIAGFGKEAYGTFYLLID